MAILKAAAKLIVREQAHYRFRGPALTLGIPEVYASAAELRAWTREYNEREWTVPAEAVEISSNKFGSRLGWVKARTFFQALDLTEVHSLDLPGADYSPEIVHDLNNPLPQAHHGRYGFVLDPGTLEHVFDVRTCLANVVLALRIGGHVVHLVPIYSYNGGYYSINPNVLHDFYRANGFGDLRAYILMWDRYRPFTRSATLCYRYREEILGSRHALADRDQVRFVPHLLFFARKESSIERLQVPIQFSGNYAAEAASLQVTRRNAIERIGKRWSAALMKVLPLSVVLYLQAAVYRYLVLLRARRRAAFRI